MRRLKADTRPSERGFMLIEPTINFVTHADAATAPTATAISYTVNYHGTANACGVGTVSASGRTFGVTLDLTGGSVFFVAGAPGTW